MALELEVGKTYVDGFGVKTRILALDRKPTTYCKKHTVVGLREEGGGEMMYMYTKSGEYGDGISLCNGNYSLVKEYKEPVVHKRVVFWIKNHRGYIQTFTQNEENVDAFRKDPIGGVIVQESIVEYIEKD